MKMRFNVIERDDAVLVPDDGSEREDFERVVEVELGEGVALEDINTSEVVLLESPDNKRLRFERGTAETWDRDFARWQAAGWIVVGFEAVRFYKTFAEYDASLDE